MALPNLAADADLTARGVTPTSVHTLMLAVASSVVRAAAGSPILQTTSTVTLTDWGGRLLRLPGLPVLSVASVKVDGSEATGWKLVDSASLFHADYWGGDDDPASVEVTLTHGLPKVPDHIVQLVCDLAIAGADAARSGAHPPGVIAEKIDDYSVTFAAGAEAVATAMELPRLTKQWLRSQFGGGVQVVTYR